MARRPAARGRESEIRDAMDGLRDLTLAVDAFREASAARFHLNTTDTSAMGRLAVLGPLPSMELARLMRLAPSSVTALVDRLARHGYVERVADPADRRKVLVSLTDEGLKVLEWGRENFRRALEGMSSTELASTAFALRSLGAAVAIEAKALEPPPR